MDNKKEKCNFEEHKEIDAIQYCHECKIYICNKCKNYHQRLLGNRNHHISNIDNNVDELFSNICKEVNHLYEYEYFCKDHNKLCCDSCIIKMEVNGKGQHKDCNICLIKDIKDEKINKLNENIKLLEDLLKNLENSIKEIKEIFEDVNRSKDEMKLKIQKLFTKLRNVLNEREDEIILEIDKTFNEIYSVDKIKEYEKLPSKINISLEKAKSINIKELDDHNKLVSTINECLNIEDNIKNIQLINSITKLKVNNNLKIEYNLKDEDFDNLIENIKTFGNIYFINNKLDSVIIKNKDDIDKFYELISNKIKINNIKLLYRASKDGLEFKSLINKINNKSNLVFLFFTDNKRIFGAFIKTKLENIVPKKYFKDESAFVFSLNNNKIYKILIPNNAIIFYDDNSFIGIGNTGYSNGLFFGNNKTKIYDKKILKDPKIYDFQKNNELCEDFDKFTELEIFEINI